MRHLSFLPLKLLSLFTFFSLVVGCASKKETQSVQLSGNRVMGLGIRGIKAKDPATAEQWQKNILEASTAALKETYQPRIVELDFTKDSLIESPENLYQIGSKEIDDLFVVDAEITDAATEINFSVMNGSNLKVVNIFKVRISPEEMNEFQKKFIENFKRAAVGAFPNPNIYPKGDPKHFANLLYVLSKKREQDGEQSLTCETAKDILQYYEKTEELYKMANERGSSRIVGQQSEAHQVGTRLEEASEKVKILKDCNDELKAGFSFTVDFGKIPEASQAYIQQAIKAADLEELLKKYTNKPVKLKFELDQSGELSAVMDIRFDRQRYLGWIAQRVPMKYKNWQVLSLDPYYALMQKMVVMQASLPKDTPTPLKNGFASMKMSVGLKTLLNGNIYFSVSGKYIPEKKAVNLAYPNSIFLTTPGFENRTIMTKDKDLFQSKGWIALGSCKGIDGNLTEDGLVYKFFGFPCN
ncbi:MAG: hypothetical protein J0L93_01080 [Deltaproteobacteria bacterium]|nr:hypothetical protein [Deltaproteobacteria bacterium]